MTIRQSTALEIETLFVTPGHECLEMMRSRFGTTRRTQCSPAALKQYDLDMGHGLSPSSVAGGNLGPQFKTASL